MLTLMGSGTAEWGLLIALNAEAAATGKQTTKPTKRSEPPS